MLSFLSPVAGAAYHVVSALALALSPLPGGLAAAAAIVLFTAGVRLALLPLSYLAFRGQAAAGRLGSQVRELRTRYARQPDRLQREMAALCQRDGAGMLAGCLPLLVQIPVLSVMYALFRSGTVDGRQNGLLARALLGVPLGSHWLSGPGPLSAHGAVFLALFALLALAVWLTVRASRHGGAGGEPQATRPAGQAREGQRSPAAPAAPGNHGAMALLPYSALVIAAVMPLAAGLYLLTTTAWAAAERAAFARRARVRHDEPSTPPGGRRCTSRPSRTSPARTPRSPG